MEDKESSPYFTVDDQVRQQNLEDSLKRNRVMPQTSPKPAKRSRRYGTVHHELNNQQVSRFVKESLENFRKHQDMPDFMSALMAVWRRNDAT